jgi:hypothetical protein
MPTTALCGCLPARRGDDWPSPGREVRSGLAEVPEHTVQVADDSADADRTCLVTHRWIVDFDAACCVKTGCRCSRMTAATSAGVCAVVSTTRSAQSVIHAREVS